MQTYQKKPQATPQTDVQTPTPLAQAPAMNALRAGTTAPTPDMLGHKIDLPEALRARMESSFGTDLSGIQLYESQAVADAGAEAITQGSRIAFAPGKLDFASMGGKALLGHEISHAVSQARGEVSGHGFLQSHALETRADHEGILAAIGQPISAAPVGAISDISAASAAGPMQAKKNQDTAPQQPATPQGHQIDAEKMQFDKWAYRKDSDYQAFQGLISRYNASSENPEAEMALMDAAMAYINKNSTDETALHKGRTAHAEDILYQLSMKGGTAAHADQNTDALITAAQNPVGINSLSNDEKNNYIEASTRIFSSLKDVYQPDSGYSSALQMVVAGVLADQNAAGASAPTYQPTSTGSGAIVSFDPGSPGFEGAHHYHIHSRVHGTSGNDAMGTTLHELTHVANGEAYQNTELSLSAEKGSTDLAARRNERAERLMALNQALPTAKTTQIADQKGGTQTLGAYHRDRLGYAGGDKLFQYLSQRKEVAGRDTALAYAAQKFQNDDERHTFGQKFKDLKMADMIAFLDTAAGGNSEQTIPADIPEDFQQTLSDADRTNAARRRDMLKGSKQAADALVSNEGLSENAAAAARHFGSGFASNTLVEYDSVINQMLMQYEHAGQQSGQADTGSKYYRTLKAMALQSHVDRQNAKLKRRIPAQS